MGWFTVKRGRLEYRGHITRQPFTEWCATRAGREAIAETAGGLRFSIFGRSRAARRILWRALDAASRSDAFIEALAGEPDRYLQVLADLCYADALPRAQVAARRVVLVPRAMAIGRAQAGLFNRLCAAPALAGLHEALRRFLLERIVTEIDLALKTASPSPSRPVHARDGWACIGIRLGTIWMDAFWAGPDGTGHVFMYELPSHGISRRDARALAAAMDQMSEAASALSRSARDAMLRAATLRRV